MPREPLPIGGLGTIRVDSLGPHRWQAVAYTRDTDGVRRRIKATAPTKAKARTALLARHSTRTPPSRGALTGATTVRDAAQRWLEQIQDSDLKTGTLRIYANAVRVHITPLIGSLRLREVTASQVQAFLTAVTAGREADGRTLGGPTTAHQCRAALSQIMRMCVLDGALTTNPVESTRTVKRPTAPVSALTPDQVHAIREHVITWGQQVTHGPRRPWQLLLDFLDVLAGTGCRPGEVLALRWEDVDLTAGTIRVTGTLVPVAGGLERQAPKTATSARWFRVPAFVVQVLRLRRLRMGVAEGPVFATSKGTWLRDSNMRRLWRSARGEQWEHVTFAAYRKAVATVIERSEGMAAAAGQLGHSSPDITRRHYVEREQMVDFASIVAALGPVESSPKVAPRAS